VALRLIRKPVEMLVWGRHVRYRIISSYWLAHSELSEQPNRGQAHSASTSGSYPTLQYQMQERALLRVRNLLDWYLSREG